MEIVESVEIKVCHRLGQGNNSPILVKLQSPKDRGVIFSHVKKIKDLKNEDDRPYRI